MPLASASRTGARRSLHRSSLVALPSGEFLHHDPVALDFVQIELDRCRRLGRCHVGGFDLAEDFTLVTQQDDAPSPDTNQDEGQYARIGISRGIGNRAIVVADRMGAVAFVELNTDGTPIGLITVQKDMRVINSRQSIDPNGMVSAPSQRTGVCTRSPS